MVSAQDAREQRQGCYSCSAVLCTLGGILILILMPMSWVKVEYYQGCLKTQRSTGKVDRSTVWRTGNHLIGPDYVFRCYEISSQNFNERLSVWSRSSESDAGSSLELDVSFQYAMDVKRLGDLYSKVALDFEGLVASKAIDALKNTAPLFGVDQFLTQRPLIEATLMRNVSSAIEDIFARVVSFELRDVRPEDEYQRARLAAAIQEESNAKELYSQQATLVRERTAVEVQQVENDAVSVRAAATAEASYLTSAAKYQATEKVENARLLGLKTLYTKLGLEAEAHKASMDYLLTLMDATETKDYVDFDPVGTVAA
mmetsp:Transcript_4957/g.15703  ORF Transcript_4957/g.15703 Transcript_4957/m.15703 type:complete len:314 (-) Transcript_4957:60-1001(-)